MNKNRALRNICLFVATVLVFTALWRIDSSLLAPAVEEGKVYKIGYTYRSALPGDFAEARVFDFADRNTPKESVVAPLVDKNDVKLVVLNSRLPESTARLTRVKVPPVVVEGITYSEGYEYVRWEYNPGRTEVQSIIPTLKPRS